VRDAVPQGLIEKETDSVSALGYAKYARHGNPFVFARWRQQHILALQIIKNVAVRSGHHVAIEVRKASNGAVRIDAFASAASDEKDRKTVYAFLPADVPWVAPVGRLDKASEGLLLLTNDSEWSARLLAPESHLEKTYHVQVATVAEAELLESMRQGVKTRDGDFLRAKTARIVRGGKRNTWLEIVLQEGKNRQIRRMLAEYGIEVLRLIRIAIGPLSLGNLPKGSCRPLTSEEEQALIRIMNRRCSVPKD